MTTLSPAWQGWQPDYNDPSTPHAWQERHGRTAPLPADAGAENDTPRARLADRRQWERLTGAEQRAALEIAAVFEMLSRGLGYGRSDWTRLRQPARDIEPAALQTARLDLYRRWAAGCRAEGLSHSLVIDTLAYGFTCAQIDRAQAWRRGRAFANLRRALSVYAAIRGWQ